MISLKQDLRVENDDVEDIVRALHAQDICQKDEIENLEKVIQELRDQLDASNEENESLNKHISSLRAEDESLNRKIAYLDETLQELRNVFSTSQNAVDQLKEKIKSIRAEFDPEDENSAQIIAKLEKTVQGLQDQLSATESALRLHEKKHECETMYAQGRVYDASRCILDITETMSEELKQNRLLIDWVEEFMERCVSSIRMIGGVMP